MPDHRVAAERLLRGNKAYRHGRSKQLDIQNVADAYITLLDKLAEAKARAQPPEQDQEEQCLKKVSES